MGGQGGQLAVCLCVVSHVPQVAPWLWCQRIIAFLAKKETDSAEVSSWPMAALRRRVGFGSVGLTLCPSKCSKTSSAPVHTLPMCNAHIRTHTHKHMHMYACTCIHKGHTNACTHRHTCTYVHTCMCTHRHIGAHMQTHMHTHT